jgi:hypothetical protein
VRVAPKSALTELTKVAGKILKGQIGQHNGMMTVAAGALTFREQVMKVKREDFFTLGAFEADF